MKRERKETFVLLLFGGVISLAFIVIFFSNLPEFLKPKPPPSLIPTPIPQSEKKIIISGVEMKNFYRFAEKTNKNGDVLIALIDKSQFVYLTKYNQFLITIYGSPFQEARKGAEQKFLEILGINKKDACNLNVVVGTPPFANPDFSEQTYPLSFCTP